MFQHKLKNCPLDEHEIRPFLRHLAADGHIDAAGSLVLTFNTDLPEHKASEHLALLREYLRGLKHKDTLYEVIDTEEIDPVKILHSSACGTDLTIETFGAFGSGIHETTGGCMDLIAQYCSANRDRLTSVRALDIGTGTGILSVFAYHRGIHDITAVDISLRSIIAALHNFILNNMAEDVQLKQGSVVAIDGEFDLIIANIFLSAIKEIFDGIFNMIVPGGSIILSGVKADKEHELLGIIGHYPSLRISDRTVRDEWLCLQLENGNE